MKTLMPDDEPPSSEPVVPKVAEPNEAGLGAPVAQQELLRELSCPCKETVVRTDSTARYVGFASSKSATWDSLRQLHPKIQEGAPFIGLSDGQLELVDTLMFFLVMFKQFWSVRDDQYLIEHVQFADPGRRSDLTEEFLALTIVLLGRRLVPTVSYFGGTKARAVRQAADTLRVAGTPAWAGLGPAHAASANFRFPFGRFVTAVTIEPRTSRKTGRPYQLAVGHPRPTNLEELDVLAQAVRDSDFMAQLQAAVDVYEFRLRNLEQIARGGAA
jgi:hypothetical protein